MFLYLCFLAVLPTVASQCTFPFSGSWVTSTLSTLTFTSDTVGPMFSGNKIFTCFQQDGTKYIVRSDVYKFGPAYFIDYTCLDFRKVSDTKYLYYHLTAEDPSNPNNERIIVHFNTSAPTVAQVCTQSVPTSTGTYSFMMKNGTLASSVVASPAILWGEFNATMSGCEGGALLDVCNDHSLLDFNYTQCGTTSFSGETLYNVLHVTTSGNDSYVTLFTEEDNPGGSNPFIPFSCMVVGTSSGNLSLTIAHQDCQENQDSGNVAAPGVTMALSHIRSCLASTTETPSGTTAGGTTSADSAGGTSTAFNNSTTSAPAVVDGSTTPENGSAASFISVSVLMIVTAVAMWIL